MWEYYTKLLILISTMHSSFGDNGTTVENGDVEDIKDADCSKNWAIVPYTPMQNYILPSFNEPKRYFNFRNVDEEIVIKQNWNDHGVAAVVWEAAIELGKFISENINIKDKKVLELGSGTGLVGIVCSRLGAKVTLTDLKEALPVLEQNVDLNFPQNAETSPKVRELKWGEFQSYKPCTYDYIIGADVVYIEDTFKDLLDTLCYLTGAGKDDVDGKPCSKKTTVYLSCKMRYTRERKFINGMRKYFSVEDVFKSTHNNIHIFKAIPK